MLKRPLLCGVLAFTIGEVIMAAGNMAWGLGMVLAGFIFWCIRQKNQSGTMPVLMLPIILCLLLGGLNGIRCRTLSPVQEYMDAYYEETGKEELECELYGDVERVEYQNGNQILIVKASEIRNKDFQYCNFCRIKIYVKEEELFVGNQIQCRLTLKRLATPSNPGEFNSRQYYRSRGIEFLGYADEVLLCDDRVSWIKHKLWELRMQAQKVFRTTMSEEYASVMNAMLLGDSGNLDSEIKQLYQRNGIAHILAISGLHVSILGSFLYRLLRKMGIPYMGAGLPVIIILLSYGWLTGESGSTLRAITMLIMAMVGDILGRTYDMLTAIGIAGVLQLAEYPSRIFDAGFLLSFGAVLALGLVLPACKEVYQSLYEEGRRKRLQAGACTQEAYETEKDRKGTAQKKTIRSRMTSKLQEALVSGIVVQLMTAPIVIYFYYEYPVYGILLNLYVIPMMTPVILLGLISLLLAPWSLAVSAIIILPCEWILESFTSLCRIAQKLPGAVWHAGGIAVWQLGIYYVVWILIYIFLKRRNVRGGMILAGMALGSFLCMERNGMQIIMLDVGQGDSILIETQEHSFLLIDGGSTSRSSVGKYVITPAVKYYGSGRLDYVFVSHMDADHINGIQELIELSEQGGIQIGCLVLPTAGKGDSASNAIRLLEAAESAQIPVVYMQSGEEIESRSMHLECLYPDAAFTFADRNNNSMVLKLTMDSFQMLFAGDLESQGEELLYRTYATVFDSDDEVCNVLKVGHHGSSGASSMEFLEWMKPEYALISCGKHNTYGHPHAEALERIENCGADIYRTDEDGAITISMKNQKIEIKKYNK